MEQLINRVLEKTSLRSFPRWLNQALGDAFVVPGWTNFRRLPKKGETGPGWNLAHALNTADDLHPSPRRVLAVYERASEVLTRDSALRAKGKKPDKRLESMISDLNMSLSPYQFTWAFASGDAGIERHDAIKVRDYPAPELLAVQAISELLQTGDLLRVRRCETCGLWIFARTNQQFCGTKCRLKRFKSSERFKAQRRTYMRKYYRLKQSGKVK